MFPSLIDVYIFSVVMIIVFEGFCHIPFYQNEIRGDQKYFELASLKSLCVK